MQQQGEFCWLAADYEMPSLYSCRFAMSSKVSAQAMPAPGPATVRLTLIRIGIELFGVEFTRDTIFPIISTMPLYIRPPIRVALSHQVVRAYKVTRNANDTADRYNEAPVYHEMAQAMGPLTIWIHIPTQNIALYHDLLMAIGYWGTADSFACCTSIQSTAPQHDECIAPLRTWRQTLPIGEFFTCFITEFAGPNMQWEDIMPTTHTKSTGIRHELYVWPMVIQERGSNGMILQRRSHHTER